MQGQQLDIGAFIDKAQVAATGLGVDFNIVDIGVFGLVAFYYYNRAMQGGPWDVNDWIPLIVAATLAYSKLQKPA